MSVKETTLNRRIKLNILLVAIGLILVGCHNTTDSTKLNVDRDIPPSEDFDAYYGFWGPNGNKIYFQHSESLGTNPDPGRLDELWELDLKTRERHMIHSGRILNADISPDGKWFVFHFQNTYIKCAVAGQICLN